MMKRTFQLVKEYPHSYPLGYIITNEGFNEATLFDKERCWGKQESDGGYPSFEIKDLERYSEFWKELKNV